MHDISQIWETFEQIGGIFVNSPADLYQKTQKITALCFDWDGVFNDGRKTLGQGSLFSEADSMGTNLLRYSLWLKSGQIPFTYIITGENNREAFQLAVREGFDAVFFAVPDKIKALQHIASQQKINLENIAYFFDDVLDLSICNQVGVRMMVRRTASPLFSAYVVNNSFADYISAHEGKDFAVREICELLIGFLGNYDVVVENRWKFDNSYKQFLSLRNSTETRFYRFVEGHFKSVESEL